MDDTDSSLHLFTSGLSSQVSDHSSTITSKPSRAHNPSIPNASTQLPATFRALLLALCVMIPGISYTEAVATLSQPAPGALAKTEGAKHINDLVKKSYKAHHGPPAHTTKPNVIKSSWMDKHPNGTEKEFSQYWLPLGSKGRGLLFSELHLAPKRRD
ncbi:hypothetical protein BDN71DRAFT_1559682 [Pleurotus eryngii]|uniref:Uncharacterized protein n=1 Tax=Pleurotus eryngii TaxID=5323 RepID=A0A9P5ZVB6_PLEER|nr:hypothetical protein BDN71DRAFT_1559682 [Pleurotus eryngii]